MTCIQGLVMDEPFKLFIDRITNTDLFGMGINNLASWVLWKEVLETGGAIAIILASTTSRVRPCDAMGASWASTVRNTHSGASLSAFVTLWVGTSSSSTVRDT